MQSTKKVALIILDGWGIGSDDPKTNAVTRASAPFLKDLFLKYPHATLRASGEDVGLPAGQMGNSEVGHLNIGAGRVVYQMLALINKAFEEKKLATNPVLLETFEKLKRENKRLHLLGLVSEGGVHSSMGHLKGLCSLAAEHGLKEVYINVFTDGRDTDPHSGAAYIEDLQQHLDKTTGQIASVIGRYFAMDRDKRWERVKLAYDLLVRREGSIHNDAVTAIEDSYKAGVTDEFIKPLVIAGKDGELLPGIEDGDTVLFFNFRTDRGRQLTTVLSQQAFPEYNMAPLDLDYITMTQYDATFKDVKILFKEEDLQNTLGQVLENAGKTQLRVAETEKYPHVTFFFSGGREVPFRGENRILIPSPKVATYDLQPQMSAYEMAEATVTEIEKSQPDFFVLNFANPDMVGHTGVFEAVVSALETVDSCSKKVIEACRALDYSVIIIADHGNAEFMVNPDGTPNTAHTTNLVPFVLVSDDMTVQLKDGRLADIAPTILQLMDIEAPAEMSGAPLIENAWTENS